MNIFNKVIPWFIPTKADQRKWYTEELSDTPREVERLLREFSEISEIYNKRLGDFESAIAGHQQLYQMYLDVKVLAQKTNFIWNRIEYKQERAVELKEFMKTL